MQLRELYTEGKNRLAQANVPEPSIEASSLLASASGEDRTSLYNNPAKRLDDKSVSMFNQYITRRINGEPNSYITGKKEFFSKDFFVNKDVLIPRPETELLVELALKHIPENGGFVVADICTGSGCIGITISSIRKNVSVIASDLSFPASVVTLKNTKLNNSEPNTAVINADLSDFLKDGSIDLLVCNPPYVTEREYQHLQSEVKNFEPREALVSGENGLSHISKIIELSKKKLKNGGFLIFEIGKGQGQDALELLNKNGYTQAELFSDLNKIERVIKAQWKKY